MTIADKLSPAQLHKLHEELEQEKRRRLQERGEAVLMPTPPMRIMYAEAPTDDTDKLVEQQKAAEWEAHVKEHPEDAGKVPVWECNGEGEPLTITFGGSSPDPEDGPRTPDLNPGRHRDFGKPATSLPEQPGGVIGAMLEAERARDAARESQESQNPSSDTEWHEIVTHVGERAVWGSYRVDGKVLHVRHADTGLTQIVTLADDEDAVRRAKKMLRDKAARSSPEAIPWPVNKFA